MADLDDLVDPPLAPPPPLEDLQRRVEYRRRRRWTARAAGGGAAVVALVAGAVALTVGNDDRTTVRAASQGGPARTAPAPTGPAAASPPGGPVVVQQLEVADQRWELVATARDRQTVCLAARTDGAEPVAVGCYGMPTRFIEAGAADAGAFTYVGGVLAKDVTAVSFNPGEQRIIDVGFPVSFFGAAIRPAVEQLSVTATKASGDQHTIAVPLPVHRRVASVNGEPVPTTLPTTQPATLPPTRPAATTPSTVPPSRAAPPAAVTPTPTRVSVVPGATNLRKQPFERQTYDPSAGTSIPVLFWGGVEPCYVLGRVDVAETAETVTITLWTGVGPGAQNTACIELAQLKVTMVELRAPLGNRRVIDGAA